MPKYTLKLSFDLRQITQTLAYEFVLDDTDSDYPMEANGPLAGTFNFQQNDTITVEVVATSAAERVPPHTKRKDILEDFEVTNCTFVSIPAGMKEALSLFAENSACSTVDSWGPIENITTKQDAENNILKHSKCSQRPLKVTTENGCWKISGYLSVQLNTANNKTRSQLYFFDPEGSAGNGGFGGP